MTALTDFLLARIAEDEAAAQILADGYPDHPGAGFMAANLDLIEVTTGYARVLAECEAKRRIVERETEHLREQWRRRIDEHRQTFDEWLRPPYGETLRDLATAYADHPDYREGWRP